MKKWRKFLSLLALSASLFSMVPGSSQANSCNPCNVCGFEIGADFIWWKPCFDEADYAAVVTFEEQGEIIVRQINDDLSLDIKYKSFCTDWEPGFRVYLGFPNFNCNWGFLGSYTYLESKFSETTAVSEEELDQGMIVFFSPVCPYFGRSRGLSTSEGNLGFKVPGV